MSNSISINTRATPAAASNDMAISASTRAKLQLNVSILQESASVSLNSENDPLALLYKSAITSINEQLEADFGPDAIQNAASQDNSPEATAGRIVSLSTAFFSAFQQQHSELEGDDALNRFMETIKGGIEKGFKEARDILQGLQVLGGDIASNIDKTYELVQKGLDDFVANQGKNTSTDEA
ncbi:DUF5610 domain-containing protein, partial [Pseudoduganella sp. OTU4001]|uniref:DUF5610 domain-containing protein n=1 Tax=Pseudoduganella sp. OTU4001 TaxID=3043854 RepID=UPI00313C796E